MSTSYNSYDAIERLIFEEGLSIEAVDIHKDLDIILIILNTKAILKQKVSAYKGLANASEEELRDFQLIAGGKAIHWNSLDEDLSLKGFLQQEIRQLVSNAGLAA